jgi:predicted RNA-binding protein Jag
MIDDDDRKDQLCTECGVGRYQETSIHDDWDGLLHCTNKKCNHEVKRYKSDDNPQPTQQMTLNKEQFAQFVENYVAQIVEGLDVESLESMVTDLLIREYETYTEEQIVGEIKEIYDDEFLAELMPTVED